MKHKKLPKELVSSPKWPIESYKLLFVGDNGWSIREGHCPEGEASHREFFEGIGCPSYLKPPYPKDGIHFYWYDQKVGYRIGWSEEFYTNAQGKYTKSDTADFILNQIKALYEKYTKSTMPKLISLEELGMKSSC